MKSRASELTSGEQLSLALHRISAIVARQKPVYVRDLLFALIGRDMKVRYKRSVLGIAWSLLTPLAQLAVLYVTFDVLLPLNVPNYFTFLFCGLLVWNWFQGALYQATSSIVDNRDLIKRPGFPAALLPIVTVASYLIHFLLAMPILLLFLLISDVRLTSALLALPLVIATQFIFTLSLAYFTATLYVRFRDMQHLLGVFLNLLFFCSPVFYKTGDLPVQYQVFYLMNPMAHLIEAYRAILLGGVFPQGTGLLVVAVLMVLLLVIGYNVFRSARDHFVDEL